MSSIYGKIAHIPEIPGYWMENTGKLEKIVSGLLIKVVATEITSSGYKKIKSMMTITSIINRVNDK